MNIGVPYARQHQNKTATIMKIRLRAGVIDGPVAGGPVGGLDDTAEPKLKRGRILDDAVKIHGAGQRQEITGRGYPTGRRADSAFLPHTGPVSVKTIHVPAATRAEIDFPVSGFTLYAAKKFKAGVPPQSMTATSDRRVRGPLDAFQPTPHLIFDQERTGHSDERTGNRQLLRQ